jgi:hypothetical protein
MLKVPKTKEHGHDQGDDDDDKRIVVAVPRCSGTTRLHAYGTGQKCSRLCHQLFVKATTTFYLVPTRS